jgi:hypothetical protein
MTTTSAAPLPNYHLNTNRQPPSHGFFLPPPPGLTLPAPSSSRALQERSTNLPSLESIGCKRRRLSGENFTIALDRAPQNDSISVVDEESVKHAINSLGVDSLRTLVGSLAAEDPALSLRIVQLQKNQTGTREVNPRREAEEEEGEEEEDDDDEEEDERLLAEEERAEADSKRKEWVKALSTARNPRESANIQAEIDEAEKRALLYRELAVGEQRQEKLERDRRVKAKERERLRNQGVTRQLSQERDEWEQVQQCGEDAYFGKKKAGSEREERQRWAQRDATWQRQPSKATYFNHLSNSAWSELFPNASYSSMKYDEEAQRRYTSQACNQVAQSIEEIRP